MSETEEQYELTPSFLNLDWNNDLLFFTHSWRDETSQFDDHPSVRWEGGSETYSRDFKCRVPKAFEDSDVATEHFIEWMMDCYPDEQGFWVA